MTDQPWQGRRLLARRRLPRRHHPPTEALDLSLAAIEQSELNAVIFVDEEQARAAAAAADVSLPFGGVPTGFKELDPVKGWPDTEASLALKDEIGDVDGTMTARLRTAGVVPVGQTRPASSAAST